jgi:transcriptional regulator with XRE-family HTH domain
MPNRVQLLRERADLTQEELAQRAGHTQPWIQRIEKGVRESAIVKIEKIARALNVHPGELFTEQPSYTDLSQDEVHLLQIYGLMDDDRKKTLTRVAEGLTQTIYTGPDRRKRSRR